MLNSPSVSVTSVLTDGGKFGTALLHRKRESADDNYAMT